ncbi:MAG: recombinase family protein [Peptococcaceae bacterium]|nr:recombinase family protein [Peptococcaceae bacterium]
MIKAAAYCRVSTERDEQLNSLANQQQFFRQYIQQQPDWELTDIYVDEGASGTAVNHRRGFLKMLADGKAGKFQILLTKEISRFARNTLDSIYYTRKLKEWGIGVIFLNDNINTLDADAELRLTIMASIAQEESRKTSERVKWGQKRQMEKGIVFGHSLLGYQLRQGALEVEETGAAVVRQIFDKFVREGKGASLIARELTAAGIPTPSGGQEWSHNVVLKILKNQKYMGDLVQKKTYTPSYLTHKKKVNRGEEPFIVLKQHHPAIISPALFAKAAAILQERGRRQREGSRYSQSYGLSGKLYCSQCGNRLVARTKKRGEKTYLYWQCYGKIKKGAAACACPTISQVYLEQILLQAMAVQLRPIIAAEERRQRMAAFYGGIQQVLQQDGNDKRQQEQWADRLSQLEREQEKLLHIYLQGQIGEDLFTRKNGSYQEMIRKLQEQIRSHQLAGKVLDTEKSRRDKMEQIMGCCEEILAGAVYREDFYREIVEKIIIEGKEQMTIFFKGVSHAVQYQG